MKLLQRSRTPSVVLLLAMVAVAAGPAEAKVLLTRDEALSLAFPGCRVERQTVYLTDAQRAAVEKRSGEKLAAAVVHPYRAECPDGPGGTAWLDVHRVRTLPETLMVVVDPAGRVARVEVLSFDEPEDYLPREGWYAQFVGRGSGDDLSLKGAIRPVTGATLTARATAAAVKRVLAVHEVLEGGAR